MRKRAGVVLPENSTSANGIRRIHIDKITFFSMLQHFLEVAPYESGYMQSVGAGPENLVLGHPSAPIAAVRHVKFPQKIRAIYAIEAMAIQIDKPGSSSRW